MGQRRFRYAPTPSRPLHAGSALAALIGWGAARAIGAEFILRIEDIDRTRCRPEHEASCLADLRWLGLDWEEGPDVGGPRGPYRQSERLGRYDDALATLAGTYTCVCSRAQVRAAQRAPHLQSGGELPYPGTCRPVPGSAEPGHVTTADRGGLRLDVHALGDAATVSWSDVWTGEHSEDVRATCGDFLLGRPGHPTYQLACVLDDGAMGITDVVRGRDLQGSVGRQILLHRALGQRAPRWAHHPLLLDDTGRKLSKRDRAESLTGLREGGADRDALIAGLAASIRLVDGSVSRLTPEGFVDALRRALGAAGVPEWSDGLWPVDGPALEKFVRQR